MRIIKIVDIQHQHLNDLYEWERDEELQVKTGVDVPRTYDQFCKSYQAYFQGEKSNLFLQAIEVDEEPIGKIELFHTENKDYIGIVVAKNRGHGIGTEALERFIDKIKIDYDVENVYAQVYEDNEGSFRFFQKNGFQSTGEQTEEWFRGQPRTLITLKKEL